MPITDLVTPAYIRRTVLDDIMPLITRSGVTVSDEGLYAKIDEAVSELEAQFGLALRQTRFSVSDIRIRTTQFSDDTFRIATMLRRPLQKVVHLSTNYGNSELFELPDDWVYVDSHVQAQVHIIPRLESRELGRVTSWGRHLLSSIYSDYMPGVFRMDYTAGFEHDLPGEHVVDTEVTDTRHVTVTGLGPDDDLRQVLYAGDAVNLGGIVYRVARVAADHYRITEEPEEDYTGEAVALRYDASILQFIGYSAAMPMLANVGAMIYGPGRTGSSLRIDSLAQTKSINPRGPFANVIDMFRERVDAARAAIAAKYSPVNIALLG